jgi:predicted ATPase
MPTKMSHAGHAQFIIVTHSPILLACPGAMITSFDRSPVKHLQ